MTTQFGVIKQVIESSDSTRNDRFNMLMVGTVVDNNDPQQMGRVRVLCPKLGDTEDSPIDSLPWAIAMSPLAGTSSFGNRGVNSERDGSVAYGMWNVPECGSSVIITCLDGDPALRIWLGCIHDQFYPHTMPHGRFLHENGNDGLPDGPLSSTEQPIEPTYTNLTKSFTKTDSLVQQTPNHPRKNLEWRTRGADTQVAALNQTILGTADANDSEKSDDFQYTYTEEDGTVRYIFGQGYDIDLLFPDFQYSQSYGGFNYSSQVYSWTTPGFHSISMDDRDWNCRLKLRTTGGHRIIMDDTNERVYISTAEGETWIELDQKGNIDIYGSRNISFRAEGDINFTTDKTFRVHAKDGIHFHSDNEVRIRGKNDVHVRTDSNLRIHSGNRTHLESDDNMNIACHGSNLNISCDTDFHLHALNDIFITADNKYNEYVFNDKLSTIVGNYDKVVGIDYKITTSGSLHIHSDELLQCTALQDIDILSNQSIAIKSGAFFHLSSSDETRITSGTDLSLLSGGTLGLDASPNIFLNSGKAKQAAPAVESSTAGEADSAMLACIAMEKWAFWTNRVPEHEPWARTMMKIYGEGKGADNDGLSVGNNVYEPYNDAQGHVYVTCDEISQTPWESVHVPEYLYTDKEVGRIERGVDLKRNDKWHR